MWEIPEGVTTRLKRIANAAIRKRTGIGFLLHQQRTVKFLNHPAIGSWGDEAVVLFSGRSCERLEPVRVVGRTPRNRPFLHGRRNLIRDGSADGGMVFHCIHNAVARLIGKVLPHHGGLNTFSP